MTPKKPAKEKAKGPGKSGPRWDRSTAEEVFAAYFTLRGFDVERFDNWLASLEDCGAKVELTERRELAIAAFQKDPDNKDSTLRHLEWIQRRWAEIRREGFLLPLARTGQRVRKPYEEANAMRKEAADKQHAEWRKSAASIRSQPQHAKKKKSDIARLIDPERWNEIRKHI